MLWMMAKAPRTASGVDDGHEQVRFPRALLHGGHVGDLLGRPLGERDEDTRPDILERSIHPPACQNAVEHDDDDDRDQTDRRVDDEHGEHRPQQTDNRHDDRHLQERSEAHQTETLLDDDHDVEHRVRDQEEHRDQRRHGIQIANAACVAKTMRAGHEHGAAWFAAGSQLALATSAAGQNAMLAHRLQNPGRAPTSEASADEKVAPKIPGNDDRAVEGLVDHDRVVGYQFGPARPTARSSR